MGKGDRAGPKGPPVVGPMRGKETVLSDITNKLGAHSEKMKGPRVGPYTGPSIPGKDNLAKGIKRINPKVSAAEIIELMDFQTQPWLASSGCTHPAGLQTGRPPDPTRSDCVNNPCPSPNRHHFTQIDKDGGASAEDGEQPERDATTDDVRMQERPPDRSNESELPSSSQRRS